MEDIELTFVNTSGASLSRPAAKRMRAHITRTNFAKRRQRIAGTAIETEQNAKRRRRQKQNKSEVPISVTASITNFDNSATFRDLQKLLFIEGSRQPGSPGEAAWFNLIATEPALTEATLAVAVQQWSPENSWQTKADEHSYTAVSLIKQRITSITTRPDGVLGAVITMAFGAALARNKTVWEIHMEGLAQIIKHRELRDPHTLPAWFLDLIVEDSINEIFGYPRGWHPNVVSALSSYREQGISELSAICDSVIQIRKVIDSHRRQPLDEMRIAPEIEEPLARLHFETRALRGTGNLHVDAAARAIELALYLLWPTQSSAHLTLLAGEFKDSISEFPIRRCAYMDFTSFQLMIGAVAAAKGSHVRAWFVSRISEAVRWMQKRGWTEPLSLLEEAIGPGNDDGLNGRFRALWTEVQNEGVIVDARGSIDCLEGASGFVR
ncbi:uncharacterized protein BDV17DRAFT_104927 [Aspergillus undulatus]|uniref:uncharacterized protein n=1 Tax=Aspergillus undulatus TaxID=1810928 RepID=UPI003CCCE3B9